MMARQDPEKFALELDGPGVEPGTVDSAKLLAFASAYFDLLRRMASDEDSPVEFHGLEVVNKCVAVQVIPNDPARARLLADTSAVYLHGSSLPNGLKTLVERVRSAFRDFGEEYKAKVIVGPWEKPLIAPEETVSLFPLATESVRAVVLRVGGSSPRVRIRSILDGDTFSVDLKWDQAMSLGPHLYQEVDFIVRIMRTGEGRVAYCDLVEFTPVEAGDPAHALAEWFRPHATFWDSVNDISDVLGRGDRSQ